ncbi:MAG: carboxypeptidase-like regulatory domain-containing protein, partial [Ignavibacteriales bacterium]|nr:carboxypeptidase-like regulatory domain-containing protein [Ignavibacteriales bacterium]
MKPTITKWVAVALLALLCAGTSAVLAQGTTTSAINGKIMSTNGEAIIGANVIAVHNPSGTTYGTASRIDGGFNLLGLRPGGPYTVTVSFVGSRQDKRDDITLRLGQNLEMNF